MNKSNFLSKLNIDEKRIVDLTIDLCRQNTANPPGDEHLCVPILKNVFEKIAVDSIEEFEREKGRTNLVARIKGQRPGKIIAIVGHTDVVPVDEQDWQNDPFDPVVKDGKIFARGAIDDKGPFAAVIEGVRSFLSICGKDFAGEIILIAAADEENGSTNGIKYLFDEVKLKVDYALIPDGGDSSTALYGEMGILGLEINSKGKAYHGSYPERGFNALVPLAELMLKLNSHDWSKFKGSEEFDHAVLNIGLMKGGSAPNIIPDHASFNAMWRYPLGIELEQIENVVKGYIGDICQKMPGAELNYEIISFSRPFVSLKEGFLAKASTMAAEDLKMQIPNLKTMRAETVAKYINQACDAEVIVNGPKDGSVAQMHQPDEYVEIESLVDFAKYYAFILYNLLLQ